jgi:arylsulfatase A-like enzyme
MTDDQTQASMSSMRNTKQLLERQGTTFSRMVVSFPLCCPSRATFNTGQYSHNHGVIHNRPPLGGYTVFDKTNWLPLWLQRAGYRTIHIGRTFNGYGIDNPNLAEVPPGWDDWETPLDPSTYDYSQWTLNDNGVIRDYPDDAHPGEYQTDFFTRRAAEQIAASAPSSQPFYLQLDYPAPHSAESSSPGDPAGVRTPEPSPSYRDAFAGIALPRPPSFNEADVFDKPQIVSDRPLMPGQTIAGVEENYQQELESLMSVDDGVARLYETLRRTGELDNTLFVFTSDNGFMHGEHRVPVEKGLPYEESIRVPLVMRGPGVPRGRRLKQLVANIDLAPTLLDAASARAGRTPDGRTLFPLMEDPGVEWGRDIVIENGRGANGVPPFRGLRTPRFLYVEYLLTGEYELYDLREDPYELRSLDDDERYDAIRLSLARRLRSLRRCRGSTCRRKPRVRLGLRARFRRVEGRRCVANRLRARLTGKERRRVQRLVLYSGRRKAFKTGRTALVERPVRFRLIPRGGRPFRVRARVTMNDGRVVTIDRELRGCRKKERRPRPKHRRR